MTATRYHFAPFTLDAARRRLYRGTDEVPLTPKALDVLLALVERPQVTVEKEELMQRLWPDTVVEEANLSQQIFTLRKTLGDTAGHGRFIATVPRRGYRFVADVQVETSGPVAPAVPAARIPLRFTIPLPDAAPIVRLPVPVLALSPDGADLIYVARAGRGTILCRRSLADLAAAPIAGTEGATSPFWSPDCAWFGFVAGGCIRRMRRGGGFSTAVVEAPHCRGATWTTDRRIVFAPGPAEGLWTVPEDGGAAQPLTSIDFEAGERTHRWPTALPDGRILFTLATAGIASFDEASLAIVSPQTGERSLVLRRASDGRVLSSGRIAFLRDGGVWTTTLDGAEAQSARPITALDGVAVEPTGIAHFTGSSEALLVHLGGGRQPHRRALLLADGSRAEEPVVAPEGEIEEPRLSPSGDRVAIGVRSRTSDLWLCDLRRRMFWRVTSTDDNFAAIWTPDGERLTFSSNRRGPTNIFTRRADGSGSDDLVVSSEYDLVPGSWSRDGRLLLFTEYHPGTGADIWVVSGGASPEPLLRTPFNEYSPAWHPGGEWFAFTSDETGEPQVYLKGFPSGARIRVSASGGSEPVWSRDGQRLYYRAGDALVCCDVELSGDAAIVSAPATRLDVAGELGTPTGLPNYDVTADGRVLLVRAEEGHRTAAYLIATLNP